MRRAPLWFSLSLFSAAIIFDYANQFIYRYAVPPGGDALGHDAIVQTILAGHYDQIYRYHTFWHLVVIAIAWLAHIPTITAMAWLGPLLLVTMGAALYYFAARSFGPIAGLAAVVIITFFSHQPIQTLYDASFPNVLAAGTVLPLTLIALEHLAVTTKKKRALLLFIGMVIVLVFSHHITTLYSLPLFLFVGLVAYLKNLRDKGASLLKLCGFLIVLFLIGFLGLSFFVTLPIGGSVHGLLVQFVKADWHWPFLHLIGTLNDPNAMWPLTIYPQAIGELVVYGGFAGFLIALGISLVGGKDPRWYSCVILCTWVIILAVGSQTPAIGFPVRLARDSAIPLTLLAGLFIQVMYDFIRHRHLPMVLFPLLIIACLMLGSLTFLDRYKQTTTPNPLIHHLLVDSLAARYINQSLPLDATIIVFQDDIYLKKFAPLHNITWIESSETAYKLAQDEYRDHLTRPHTYLYVEIRRDREEAWNNNQGIIERYLQADATQLVATFEQPEKKIYLFRIVSSPPTSATKAPAQPGIAKKSTSG